MSIQSDADENANSSASKIHLKHRKPKTGAGNKEHIENESAPAAVKASDNDEDQEISSDDAVISQHIILANVKNQAQVCSYFQSVHVDKCACDTLFMVVIGMLLIWF